MVVAPLTIAESVAAYLVGQETSLVERIYTRGKRGAVRWSWAHVYHDGGSEGANTRRRRARIVVEVYAPTGGEPGDEAYLASEEVYDAFFPKGTPTKSVTWADETFRVLDVRKETGPRISPEGARRWITTYGVTYIRLEDQVL